MHLKIAKEKSYSGFNVPEMIIYNMNDIPFVIIELMK
jgi:hypothetical protein